MENRIVDSIEIEDAGAEYGLRLADFDEYIGQERVKENLRIFVESCSTAWWKASTTYCSVVPGLGKTTLAHIIAQELGSRLHVTSGPALEKKGDLAGILTNLEEHDVLFIDEIHRLSAVVEENLYPAMEDLRFDVVVGDGVYAQCTIELRPFTLVGATTRAGLLTSPMRDRFGVVEHLEFYTPDELGRIVSRSAGLLGVELRNGANLVIAQRSRGTPRIANRLLRRIRDIAEVRAEGVVTVDVAEAALEQLDIDQAGFDRMDEAFITDYDRQIRWGSSRLGYDCRGNREEKQTVEDVYEPYLLKERLH